MSTGHGFVDQGGHGGVLQQPMTTPAEPAEDNFARFTGTRQQVEARTPAETLTDIGAAAAIHAANHMPGGSDLLNVLRFFNGTFLESFDALVTSDGAIVTLTLTNAVSGNLTMVFSDGESIFDLSGSDGLIALTAGSDTSPTKNFVYILKSDKILTVSTSGWPTTDYIRIGFFFVPSAGKVQAKGVFVNHNMNDHASDQGTNLGHLSHITERIRAQSAIYKTGAALTVTPSSGGTVVDVAVTAGVVYQMHQHATPALNTATGGTLLVVNQNGAAYDDVTDLETLTNDSKGTAVKKYFNWVFWGTANKEGEFAPLMLNLPNGSYNKLASAIADTSGFDVLTMPAAFNVDSTTGFLNSRVTMSLSGGVFAVESVVDLRGSTPQSVAGGGVGGLQTEFADNAFRVFDDGDATKEMAFQLSGITTGNTRTITMADQNIDLTPGTGSFATEAEGSLAATSLQKDGSVALTAPWAANNDITGLTKLEVDNVRIDGNTIDTTVGTLAIAADGVSGGVTITAAPSAILGLITDLARITASSGTDVTLRFQSTGGNEGNLVFMEDEQEFHFDSLVQATQLKSTGTLEVDGVATITGLATGGLTDYDLKVGDTTTPDYGMIQFGNAVIGRTSYDVGAIHLNGAIMVRNIGGPVSSEIEFIWTESAGNTCRFALPKSAVGNATYNSRSMMLAGPAPADTDFVKVSYWQGQGIFHNLACDTTGDGADLGVQNDLEVEGDVFTDSLRESTSGAGISITHAGTAQANTDFLKLVSTVTSADLYDPGPPIVRTDTSILWRQAHSGGTVVDMGRIGFAPSADWTPTGSTQDGEFFVSAVDGGVMTQRLTVTGDNTGFGGVTMHDTKLWLYRNGANAFFNVICASDDDTENARAVLRKAGGTFASPTAVVDGERIGQFEWRGYDGTSYQQRAALFVDVDGTVVDISNAVPMAMSFRTGTTSSPVDRLIIDSSGDLLIATSGARLAFLNADNYISKDGTRMEYESAGAGGHVFQVATSPRFRVVAASSSFLGGLQVSASALGSPATSAILELESTTGAFLPPRMTTTQRNALTAVNGMILYNESTGELNYRKAGAWVAI